MTISLKQCLVCMLIFLKKNKTNRLTNHKTQLALLHYRNLQTTKTITYVNELNCYSKKSLQKVINEYNSFKMNFTCLLNLIIFNFIIKNL